MSAADPNGLIESEYKEILKQNSTASKWNWRVMRRDPTVFVRGAVSHTDHATVHLDIWHRVLMNSESPSRAMAFVAFLD
jgi:hypothetical protein